MRTWNVWLRVVSLAVPSDERRDWLEEWSAELSARGGTMTHAWGALADAWYLRTEGWTMTGMWRDVRTAVRGLIRKPFFTAMAGVTLAVGIGANTAIYSVVDGVLINPLPYPESDRLVSYNHTAPGVGVPLFPHSEGTYLHYAQNVRMLEAFAVVSQGSVTLIAGEEPQQIGALFVTQGFQEVMAVQPALGAGFSAGDDREGAEPVAMLAHALWSQAFGADRALIGTMVEVDGVQRRIVGVMPEGFELFADDQIYIPIAIDEADPALGSFGAIGLGRLSDGTDIPTANAEMNDLLTRFSEANPDDLGPDVMQQAGLTADVKPLKELFVEDIRQALWVLLGTVGFVLLIACANVANLFLVRAEARQREQALRTALGASRLDIVRQYFTESIILSVGGGALGLLLAAVGVQGLLRLAPVSLPDALSIGIDGSVLAFTAAISLMSGLLFGLMPILGYGRSNLTGTLKEGGRASTSGRDRHRVRSMLVVAQVALSLVLLVGSGLMVRSFVAMRDADLGFDHENRLTFRVGLPEAEYPDAQRTAQFYRRFQERLASAPGIAGVSMISGLPLSDSRTAGAMEPLDRPFPEGELGPLIERREVTPGYFEVMGIELIAGRDLTWNDAADGNRAVVVNETLAATFWPGQGAIGQMIRNQGEENAAWEVVGVARDVRFAEVRTETAEMIYRPTVWGEPADPQATYAMSVVLETLGEPLGAVGVARDALREISPRLPMIGTQTVTEIVEDSMASTSFTVVLLGIAAAIALILGTVGIYGVISYIVSRRTQEIGVRMALGAPAATVLRTVVGQGLRLTAFGIAIGLLGAWGLSRTLASLLYGVSATDTVTFVGTSAMLMAVATLAVWIPARKASRVDPVEALRSE